MLNNLIVWWKIAQFYAISKKPEINLLSDFDSVFNRTASYLTRNWLSMAFDE